LTAEIAADVAPLGSGFTGLSAASYIRSISPHERVVALEAKGCGNKASRRNGAMVQTMPEDPSLALATNAFTSRLGFFRSLSNISNLV
jgi:glycine/D-amino acid oxidase-like deaminating enzyme